MGSEATTMQILKILSDTWKSGATIEISSDGKLHMKNHERVPAEIMQAAEKVFSEIEVWFFSWKDANVVDLTIMKTLHLFCGWQPNDKLNNWLCADLDSLMLLNDWTIILSKNGWNDIYTDYREFESDKSNVIKRKLYDAAVAFAKGAK